MSLVQDAINQKNNLIYTNAKQAKIFVEEIGVDTLVIAIGTAHGKVFKFQGVVYRLFSKRKNYTSRS